ncbi:MAG: virulence RhuM family protein [Bacteroidales bacterium]|jgi:hypothetical protein|nr:virulence RhuM family protein [Bacteroidales bacterium]
MNENELKIGENQIAIYQLENSMPLEVLLQNETIWLSQQQLSELVQSSRTTVVEHIKHIYEESELDEIATCRKFRQVRKEGGRSVTRELPHYNLDLIISLGYRIKSRVATHFRQWATQVLKSYLIDGYVVNEKVLKEKNAELINHLQTLSVLVIKDIPITKKMIIEMIASQHKKEITKKSK